MFLKKSLTPIYKSIQLPNLATWSELRENEEEVVKGGSSTDYTVTSGAPLKWGVRPV